VALFGLPSDVSYVILNHGLTGVTGATRCQIEEGKWGMSINILGVLGAENIEHGRILV
jgi:hypothetical protein